MGSGGIMGDEEGGVGERSCKNGGVLCLYCATISRTYAFVFSSF